MLALFALIGSVLWVSLSGALSPGPLFTLTVRESARHGFRAGPLISLGHAVAELAVVLALAFGLSHVLKHQAVTGTIALLGGAFILWMGLQILRTLPQQRLELVAGGAVAAGAPRPLARDLVPAGILISVSNPYWLIWWATVGAGFMTRSLDYGVVGVGSVYLAHISTDFAWLGLVAFALATGRRLVGTTVYRGVLAVCGLFLLGLGVFFIYAGTKAFLG